MNIKDLRLYDIKNFSVNKLLGDVYQRKDFLINIGVLALTIFMSMKFAHKQTTSASQLTSSIRDLENKIKATKELDLTNLQLTQFLEKLPKGVSGTDEVVAALNNLALKNDIYISSFDPKGQDKSDYFTKYKIQLTFTVNRFEDLGQFVYDLENSRTNFRVDRFQAALAQKQNDRYLRGIKSRSAPDDTDTVTVDMEILAISIKDNK